MRDVSLYLSTIIRIVLIRYKNHSTLAVSEVCSIVIFNIIIIIYCIKCKIYLRFVHCTFILCVFVVFTI